MNWRAALAVILIAWSAGLSAAKETPTGLESLRRFFNEVKRYTARFEQVVLDEERTPLQESKGRLWIERPNKFRWNYETPYKQQIVSDGERLWVYDEDLRQVTVRSLKEGLLETPAALLAGKGVLEERFNVKDAGTENDIAWIELTPKDKESGFERARFGFVSGRLRTFEIIDALGQMTRYTVSDALENQPIDPARFSFTPPAGVDVVGGP